MKISLTNLFNLIVPSNNSNEQGNAGNGNIAVQTEKKQALSYTPEELSAAVLANVTYNNDIQSIVNDLKLLIRVNEILLPDDFYEKLDYANVSAHFQHLNYLIKNKTEPGYAIGNGYFYSKDGADAFDILQKNYSIKSSGSSRSALDIMLNFYNPDKILMGKKRGLFDDTLKATKDYEFEKIECLLDLSDEEFERVKKSGLIEKGIFYASKNDDINQMFIQLQKDKKTALAQYELVKLDEILTALEDENKIKNVAQKLGAAKHKNVIHDFLRKLPNDNVDLITAIDNLDSMYELIHANINDFKDDAFTWHIGKIISLVKKYNAETIKELIQLKGMNQSILGEVADYMYKEENAKIVKELIDEIKAGKEDLICLPSCKYAQINQRVKDAKNVKLTEYQDNIPLSEAEEKSKLGDIFAHGNDMYIKEEDKATKLGLDKAAFKKLFPAYETLCIQQGEDTGNCYFLTGGLISFWKNPKGRAILLKMFEKEGDDIIVRIPAFKNHPVRFKNGEIQLTENHAKSSLGNLMLEQAYAKAKYASEKNIPIDASFVNGDKAMEYIYRGFESDVFNEFTEGEKALCYIAQSYKYSPEKPKNYKYLAKADMTKIFDKFSNADKYIICLGSGIQDNGYSPEYGITPHHSYAVENIDTENKTVTIVNPYNSLYTSTISYEQATKLFSTISIIEP